MSEKKYYRSLHQEVWDDEEVRKNGITQEQVKVVIGALTRHIWKTLRDEGIFRWKNVMVLKTKLIKGFETFNVVEGKTNVIDDYVRIQFKPSENLKKNVKGIDKE